MKKTILILALFLFTFNSYSQLGVKVGYANAKPKLTMSGISISGDGIGGFMIGLTNLSEISDNLKWGVDLTYASYSSDGDSLGAVEIPIYLQYYTSGEGLYIKGGAFYRNLTEDDIDGFKKGAFGLGLGVGFDVSEKFGIDLGYDLQLSDSLKDVDDASYKLSALKIGVKYMF